MQSGTVTRRKTVEFTSIFRVIAALSGGPLIKLRRFLLANGEIRRDIRSTASRVEIRPVVLVARLKSSGEDRAFFKFAEAKRARGGSASNVYARVQGIALLVRRCVTNITSETHSL